jgi:hydrogenase maturation protease
VTQHALVVGIGNPSRGDDGVGIAVARRLRDRDLPCVRVIESNGDVGTVMQAFADFAQVILVDASHGGARPGAVRRFDARVEKLPLSLGGSSTHGLGLAEAIELARALGALPPSVAVYAIEGRAFERGGPLSRAVAAAALDVEQRIASEVGAGEDRDGAVVGAPRRAGQGLRSAGPTPPRPATSRTPRCPRRWRTTSGRS